MSDSSHKGYPKIISPILIPVAFVFFCAASVSAAKELSQLEKEARAERSEGLKYQNAGDLAAAAAFYQRAIQIDPAYAAAYNDLAIIYEAQGYPERAKELYLKAIEVEPQLLGPYSNLALLYEKERDLNQAAYYWARRAEFGQPDDPWTIKAQRRLADIKAVVSNEPVKEIKERQAAGLSRQMQSEDSKALARRYLKEAKRLYKQGREVEAFRMASEANQLDPANREVEKFMNTIARRILAR